MKFLIGLIALAAALGGLVEVRQRRRVRQALEAEARRSGGRFEPGTWLRYPSLILADGAAPITISVFHGSNSRKGQSPAAATADFPAPVPPETRVRIRSKSTQALGERLTGMERAIPVSDRSFGERFQVDGNDPVLAAGLLDADLTHRLVELDRKTRSGIELRVEGGAGSIFFSRGKRFWDFPALIDLARGFRDRVERNAAPAGTPPSSRPPGGE